MPAPGITAIALMSPIVASNAVFSFRRASRGVDAMDENPIYALANMNIAAAQVLKGARAVKAASVFADSALEGNKSAVEFIKQTENLTKTQRCLKNVGKGFGKVLNFTADHINPFIVATSALKVAGSDDKLDEAARESTRLTCMFTAEAAAKKFIGLPYSAKNAHGEYNNFYKEGAYKKLFNQKQLEAISDFCATKKWTKHAIGGAKGLLFVGASIAGYKLGDMIANSILGKQKTDA